MSDHDKDDLEGVKALPVYDRVTSKFMWIKKPPPAPAKPGTLTYGIEVTDEEGNPMPFVANGVWVRLKWSGKTGQRAKMYPTLKTGYRNDEETQFFRQVQSYRGA